MFNNPSSVCVLFNFSSFVGPVSPLVPDHRLRGSTSPVLTATGLVNGRWQFLIFMSYNGSFLQCFDAVGWAVGRASGP